MVYHPPSIVRKPGHREEVGWVAQCPIPGMELRFELGSIWFPALMLHLARSLMLLRTLTCILLHWSHFFFSFFYTIPPPSLAHALSCAPCTPGFLGMWAANKEWRLVHCHGDQSLGRFSWCAFHPFLYNAGTVGWIWNPMQIQIACPQWYKALVQCLDPELEEVGSQLTSKKSYLPCPSFIPCLDGLITGSAPFTGV